MPLPPRVEFPSEAASGSGTVRVGERFEHRTSERLEILAPGFAGDSNRHLTDYHGASSAQLYDLCHALGSGERARQHLAVQSFLMEPWGARELPSLAPYPSRIGDDHSPYEYSLQFSRSSVELRLLLEAQAGAPSLGSNQAAALALNARIVERYKVDLTRFRLVEDLFCPSDPHGPFSLWHAVCFDEDGQPDFKIYTNPRVKGGARARELIKEATARLGFKSAAHDLIDTVIARGGVPNYFSLDLAKRLGSRVKLYFEHPDVSVSELEAIFALAPANVAGDVAHFCRELADPIPRFTRKPVCYCFSFVEGTTHPVSVTLHLPVAHYRNDDASVFRSVWAFLSAQSLQVGEYERAVRAMARRPLEAGSGLQSYASFRRERSGLKLTVYLSPELFSVPYASALEPFREGHATGGVSKSERRG